MSEAKNWIKRVNMVSMILTTLKVAWLSALIFFFINIPAWDLLPNLLGLQEHIPIKSRDAYLLNVPPDGIFASPLENLSDISSPTEALSELGKSSEDIHLH
ncbi:hypothetical protein SAY86_021494 [Trapa natans]|uniref:Uncharacterized protein n=1 Tax=Trapa natans TaxID=22666 RepID=A0AAN7MKI4_TRANT|nr:hypothetical protein SAY86_021494 [Trapa natans]